MREHAYLQILDANTKMQWNIAMILEAKAVEAEKVRNWALNHLSEHAFTSHADQLKTPIQIHEQLVEVIEGLTKLQHGLAHHLKVVLEDHSDHGGFDGFGGEMNESFGMGDFGDDSSGTDR